VRAFAALAAVSTCSLALAWAGPPAQLALPPGAVSLVNEDHFGSRRALCVETGGTLVQRGPQRIRATEVWAGEKDHLQAWLSKRLARPLTVPDLRSDGLALVGGRLLPAQNDPAAQFMYEDDTGHRVTLYIIPAKQGRETSFRYAKLDKLEAFFWTNGAISCALVGDLPRDQLQEIASQAYKQLG